MSVFWESLVFSQNTNVSRAGHTWPLDLTSCWLRATQLLHTINIAFSCLALAGFPTVGNTSSTKCFLKERVEGFSKKEIESENWSPSGKPRKDLYKKSSRKDRKASVWGGSSLPWVSKSISEEMPVESVNVPMEFFPVILLQSGLQFYCSVQTKSKI